MSLLDKKKKFEESCEKALKAKQWSKAAREAARAAGIAFSLAERTEGVVSVKHVEDGEEWLSIADTLQSRAANPNASDRRSAPQEETGKDGDRSDWEMLGSPNVRFDDIVGMDELKQRIRRYILKAENPEELSRWPGARSGDGMILFGPPGTGKTFFAKAVATELDAAFYDVKGSNLLSKWVGESQKNVSRLFESISGHERAVLFMDEIDGLLAARGTGSSSVREGVLTEFLSAMDGVRSNMRSLLFIGATNRPVALDRAILSRVGTMIYVGLPDAPAREAMLAKTLSELPEGIADDVDVNDLVQRFDNCSMRDIRRFIDCLIDLGIVAKIEQGSGKITRGMIDQAWAEASPSPLSPKEIARYKKLAEG